MKHNKCLLCSVEITAENDTEEHIIPNAIGGRKTITGFICHACNIQSGDDWDAELAKQLNPFSLIFHIVRDRGNAPSQKFKTTGGGELELNHDGTMQITKPTYTETPTQNGVKINIKARTVKEAETRFGEVKKNYNIDFSSANVRDEKCYTNESVLLNMSIGGELAGRSIIKAVLALVCDAGINPMLCEHGVNCLKDTNAELNFGYYYEKDLVKDRIKGLPFHCIHVRGVKEKKLILGYVEYFGCYRIVSCLSSIYAGEDFEHTYAINPVDGKSIQVNVDLDLSHDEVRAAYEYRKIPPDLYKEAFVHVQAYAASLSIEKEKARVIERTFKLVKDELDIGDDVPMTPELQQKIFMLALKEMLPFIQHQQNLFKTKTEEE